MLVATKSLTKCNGPYNLRVLTQITYTWRHYSSRIQSLYNPYNYKDIRINYFSYRVIRSHCQPHSDFFPVAINFIANQSAHYQTFILVNTAIVIPLFFLAFLKASNVSNENSMPKTCLSITQKNGNKNRESIDENRATVDYNTSESRSRRGASSGTGKWATTGNRVLFERVRQREEARHLSLVAGMMAWCPSSWGWLVLFNKIRS